MLYRKFGKTGVKVSILGCGTMRLPVKEVNGNKIIDEELSIKIIKRGIELGINYIDTAYGYCQGQSEIIVGKAIKEYRDRVHIATKCPMWNVERKDDYRRFLEEQLKKIDVEYIDFYHFHSLNWQFFTEKVVKFKLIDEALKAKEQGLIKHISFSFHDKPEIMKKIIDTAPEMETVLCQYNILDRVNEDAIQYAREKGIGVAVMGPVGGGRLADFPVLMDIFKGKSPSEIALKFVFANKNVSVALSGMNSIDMVEENVMTASSKNFLTEEEKHLIDEVINKRKGKGEIPCTGCQYCLPCPQEISIPEIFNLYNQFLITGSYKYREMYQNIGKRKDDKRQKADACKECGKCEEKCPQGIKIKENLKKIHKIFS
ncbi:MAG: aldo/keto reductase [Candidatus Omnitrophica bacterium]|nr:aldo/keto reductase [Candidatus Omnitrophota bacterium]